MPKTIYDPYEGQFGAFLGTVIGSNYFITAKHIGGSVGQTFTFNGANYTTTAVFPDSSSDLQIWQVSGTFPSHAQIYSAAAGTEPNANLVVFGRGTQRGDAVFVGSDSHPGGWLWGTSDGVERWGTNVAGSNDQPDRLRLRSASAATTCTRSLEKRSSLPQPSRPADQPRSERLTLRVPTPSNERYRAQGPPGLACVFSSCTPTRGGPPTCGPCQQRG